MSEIALGSMGYPTPYLRVRRRELASRAAIVTVALLILATLLDGAVYHLLAMDEWALERKDWYQVLRQVGYLPTWLLVALVLVLRGRRERCAGTDRPEGGSKPVVLALSAALAGLAAELLKLVIGRERPTDAGEYAFKPVLGAVVDSSNLGFPSSHTAVAFGAGVALARLYPGVGWVAVPLAAGCGLTRMLAGAHFLSDVVGGAAVGFAAATWVVHRAGWAEDRWS